MTYRLSPVARRQFFDINGNPLVGGKLFHYLNKTTTKVSTRTTALGDVLNENPIILDADGRTPYGVWLNSDITYTEVLAPATDTDPPTSPIYTENDIITDELSGYLADVKNYGAMGDGSTDDSAAIQAATDYVASIGGGVVYFPPGNYAVYSQIWVQTSGIAFVGHGIKQSQIFSHVDGDTTLYVGLKSGTTNITFKLSGIGFEYSGTLPSSSGTVGITLNRLVAPSILTDFVIQHFNKGLNCKGNLVGNYYLSNFVIGNYDNYGILLDGKVQGVWINTGKIYARNDGSGPVSTSIGIQLSSALGIFVSNLDVVVNNRGILIDPAAGELIQWLFFTQISVDSNTAAGIDINPTGGVVYGVKFEGCWSSSNTNDGVNIRGSAGSIVDGITFTDFTALNNDRMGIEIGPGTGGTIKNVKITGGLFMSNNQASVSMPAIGIGADITHFTIVGATCGTIQSHVNNQTYGIRVYPGASDYYIITNNMLVGNVSGTLLDGGTGVNKAIANNI